MKARACAVEGTEPERCVAVVLDRAELTALALAIGQVQAGNSYCVAVRADLERASASVMDALVIACNARACPHCGFWPARPDCC